MQERTEEEAKVTVLVELTVLNEKEVKVDVFV